MTDNPYAAPKSVLVQSNYEVEFDGKYTLVPQEINLPNYCIKCGQPGHKSQTRSHQWMHPIWYLTVFLNLLVLIIVYLITRKKLEITYSLCEEHLKKRTKKRLILFLSFMLVVATSAVTVVVAKTVSENLVPVAMLVFIFLFLLWFIALIIVQGDFKVIKAKKRFTDKGLKYNVFYLKGIDPRFLEVIGVIS